MFWASGLSSSIALAQATPGSKLNIVQAVTGNVLPLGSTIFTRFNLWPCVLLILVLPFVFRALEPRDVQTGDVSRLSDPSVAIPQHDKGKSLAVALNNAWILNLVLAVAGLGYIVWNWVTSGFSLDIDSMILILFCAGLLLHWTPIAYVHAINNTAGVIALRFDAFANAHTLPFWSYRRQTACIHAGHRNERSAR